MRIQRSKLMKYYFKTSWTQFEHVKCSNDKQTNVTKEVIKTYFILQIVQNWKNIEAVGSQIDRIWRKTIQKVS